MANNAVDSSRGEVEMRIDASNNGASHVITKTQLNNPSWNIWLTNGPKVKMKQIMSDLIARYKLFARIIIMFFSTLRLRQFYCLTSTLPPS